MVYGRAWDRPVLQMPQPEEHESMRFQTECSLCGAVNKFVYWEIRWPDPKKKFWTWRILPDDFASDKIEYVYQFSSVETALLKQGYYPDSYGKPAHQVKVFSADGKVSRLIPTSSGLFCEECELEHSFEEVIYSIQEVQNAI